MKRERYEEDGAEGSGVEKKSSSYKRGYSDQVDRADEDREHRRHSRDRDKKWDKNSEHSSGRHEQRSWDRHHDRSSRNEEKGSSRHGDRVSSRHDERTFRHEDRYRDRNYGQDRDSDNRDDKGREYRYPKEKDSGRYSRDSRDKSQRRSKFDFESKEFDDGGDRGRHENETTKTRGVSDKSLASKDAKVSGGESQRDVKTLISSDDKKDDEAVGHSVVGDSKAASVDKDATKASAELLAPPDKSKEVHLNGFVRSSLSSSSDGLKSTEVTPSDSSSATEKKITNLTNWDQTTPSLPPQTNVVTNPMPSASAQLAALLAAKKAAEMVNQNLGVPSIKDVEAKKKLLWGSKKATSQDTPIVGANHWDSVHFNDPSREEKFHKLMGVKSDMLSKTQTAGNPLDPSAKSVDSSPNPANPPLPLSEEKQAKIQSELEKQFEMGLRRRGGCTDGLGL